MLGIFACTIIIRNELWAGVESLLFHSNPTSAHDATSCMRVFSLSMSQKERSVAH